MCAENNENATTSIWIHRPSMQKADQWRVKFASPAKCPVRALNISFPVPKKVFTATEQANEEIELDFIGTISDNNRVFYLLQSLDQFGK